MIAIDKKDSDHGVVIASVRLDREGRRFIAGDSAGTQESWSLPLLLFSGRAVLQRSLSQGFHFTKAFILVGA